MSLKTMPGFGKSGTSRMSFFRSTCPVPLSWRSIESSSALDRERCVAVARRERGLLDAPDLGRARADAQIVPHRVERLPRALGHDLHASVVQILHVADEIALLGALERPVPESHPLHESADDEASRGFHVEARE